MTNVPSLEQTMRDLDRVTDATAALLATPNPPGSVARRFATVIGTHPSLTPPTVDVLLGGTSVFGVRYLLSYSPKVNDVVAMDIVFGDPLVLGRMAQNSGAADDIVIPGNVTMNQSLSVAGTVTTGPLTASYLGSTGNLQVNGTGTIVGDCAVNQLLSNTWVWAGRSYPALVLMGAWPGGANYAMWANYTAVNATGTWNSYALLQGSGGDYNTYLNACPGYEVHLRQGNQDLAMLRQSGVNCDFRVPSGIPPLFGGLQVVIVPASQQLGVPASSVRFKTDLCDLDAAGPDNPVWRMRPRRFRFIRDTTSVPDGQALEDQPDNPLECGLLAEDLAEIAPDTVVNDADGLPLGMNIYPMFAYLVDACQHLARRLDALEESRGPAAA